MAWTTILALCLIARAHGLSVGRRTALAGLSSLGASPFAARAAEQQMRTSSDVSSLSELSGTGARSANLGASTIAGKSRPVTGCVLLDSVSSSGPDATPTLIRKAAVVDDPDATETNFGVDPTTGLRVAPRLVVTVASVAASETRRSPSSRARAPRTGGRSSTARCRT